jgi:hypothetical protein
MSLISDPVDKTSRSEVKIALFRSLFRGRDDVYPRRFESRKSGRDERPAVRPLPHCCMERFDDLDKPPDPAHARGSASLGITPTNL